MLPTSASDHLPCPAHNHACIYSIFIYSTTQCGDIQEQYQLDRWQKTKTGAPAGKLEQPEKVVGFEERGEGRTLLKIGTSSLPACLFPRFVPTPTVRPHWEPRGRDGNGEQRQARLFSGPLSFAQSGKCRGQRAGSSTTVNDSSFLWAVSSPGQKTLGTFTI